MGHKRAGGSRVVHPEAKTRQDRPRMTQTRDGAVLWCPFCVPSHPLLPGQPSVCGTQLDVVAVQTIYPARVARRENMVCLKCGKSGEGEMVKYMNGFIHLVECAPDVNLLRTAPKFSPLAGLVFNLPKPLRAQVCKLTGYPQQVMERTPDGKDTGKILGYFFLKGSSNAGTTAKSAA